MPTIVSYKHGFKHTYTVFKILLWLFLHLFVYMGGVQITPICGGHRTTSWSQFSPSIMWLSVIRLMPLNMTASVFIKWTILPSPNTTNFGTWMWTLIWLLERKTSKIINSYTCFLYTEGNSLLFVFCLLLNFIKFK